VINGTMDFDGKVAVITGSTRGWGFGTAKQLARRGAQLVIAGTSQEGVDRACAELANLGPGVVGVVGDLMEDPQGAGEAIVQKAIDAYGQIDILINNAGMAKSGNVWEMADEAWTDVMNIQVNAQFYTTRAASKHMIERGQGGRIINAAGGAGVTGLYGHCSHAASKGAGLAAVITFALELAPYDITVNAVAGMIDTDQSRPFLDMVRADQGVDLPAREIGYFPPEEAAALHVWLASDEAAGVSGQYFHLYRGRVQLWRMAEVETTMCVDTLTPEAIHASGLGTIAGNVPRIDKILGGEDVTSLRRTEEAQA
jgi:NAD(P)-dependent dehydrogenase (short-subunit alcohol dehydrogenase family)